MTFAAFPRVDYDAEERPHYDPRFLSSGRCKRKSLQLREIDENERDTNLLTLHEDKIYVRVVRVTSSEKHRRAYFVN